MMSKRENALGQILSWCKLAWRLERSDDSALNAIPGTKWVRPTSTASNAEANKTVQICTRWERTWGVYTHSGPLELSLAELVMFLIVVEHWSFHLTWFSLRQRRRKGKPSGKLKYPRDFTANFLKCFENIRMQQSICNCRRNWCQPGQEIAFRLLRQMDIFICLEDFDFFFWEANSL